MSSSSSKYQIIASNLEHQIRNGIYRPGQQLPSEQELRDEYSVSRFTVRRALTELCSSGLIESRHGLGSFVSQGEAKTCRGPVSLHLIDFSVKRENEYDHFQSQLVTALYKETSKYDMGLTIYHLEKHQQLSDFIMRHGIPESFKVGVILHCPFTGEDLQLFENAGVPYVIIPCGQTLEQLLPQVGTDDEAGIELCCRHLLDYGHRRIGFICCQPGQMHHDAMLASYQATLGNAGIEFDQDLIIASTPWDKGEGFLAMGRLIKRECDFTGLLIVGEQATIGALDCLKRAGLRIPEDVSIVVFDRYNWMDTISPLHFSGSQQNIAGVAAEAVHILEEERKAGAPIRKTRLLPPEFIKGNTCLYHFSDKRKTTAERG